MLNRQRKGFTLIELLLVLSIISILASIILVQVNSARVRSRNAARLESVHVLLNGFGLGQASRLSWPTVTACVSSTTCLDTNGTQDALENATVRNFLGLTNAGAYPSDPTGGSRGIQGYRYKYGVSYDIDGDSFADYGIFLIYYMEKPGNCGRGVENDDQLNYLECVIKLD